MKKTLMCATAAAAFASAGLSANAEGWYGRTDLQYSFDGKVDHDAQASVIGKLSGDSSVSELAGAGLGLGYAFGNGLRLEGAAGFRSGELDVTSTTSGIVPGTTVLPAGQVAAMDLMINGIYDFNADGTVKPYIGAGVGGVRVRAKAANRVTGPSNGLSAANGFNDTATGIGYQGLAGIGFKMSDRLTLDLGYKYLSAEDLEFDGNHGGVGYDVGYTDHTASIGLRFAFGAPVVVPPPVAEPEPPAPEPEPPAPPAPPADVAPIAENCSALNQEFVVYFEWDRSDLTSQAAAVIDQAVANISGSATCRANSVTIIGHTDTSGATAYNDALSARRAGVVASALSDRGISASLIGQSGKGESEPAKETRDGVREPLNRRSEVRILVQ